MKVFISLFFAAEESLFLSFFFSSVLAIIVLGKYFLELQNGLSSNFSGVNGSPFSTHPVVSAAVETFVWQPFAVFLYSSLSRMSENKINRSKLKLYCFLSLKTDSQNTFCFFLGSNQ